MVGLHENALAESNGNIVSDLAQQTYRRLREMIISGELPSGHHLKQVHLAQMLKISQTPVREAIKLLEQEGWVVSTFNKGTLVRTFSTKDLQDTYEVREMLEGLTARKAATSLNEDQIGHLEKLAKAIDRINSTGPLPSEVNPDKNDADFHLDLAKFVGNTQVLEVFQHLFNLEMLMIARGAGTPNQCLHIHIIQAIKSREPDWAEMVARRHIREAYQGLMNSSSGLYQISPEGRRCPAKVEKTK
jgi:DNA-binding GntR family transcriptional regulator